MKKKSIGIVIGTLVLALSLTACGKNTDKDEANTPTIDFSTISENANNNNATTTSPATETTTTEQTTEEEIKEEEVVEEESHEGMYRSELTNEWIDEALMNQRPIAVMVDNEKTALPHYGLTEADVVYEMVNSTANNRITRLMAIVKDWEKIEQFGSIRSVRPTNVILATEWNAVLCHDGGPFYINDWIAKKESNNFSGGFSRVNNGKSREFTEYILAGDLQKRFDNSGYSREYNSYYKGEHFVFSNTEFDLSDKHTAYDKAETITLPFPHNSSTLKYNSETGTYDYYEYGSLHEDPQHDNAPLTFENVILQSCEMNNLDENGYMIYNVIGSGEGYYITNGKAVKITWLCSEFATPTVFIDNATGKQIEMNTGKTYIGIVPDDAWSKIEFK